MAIMNLIDNGVKFLKINSSNNNNNKKHKIERLFLIFKINLKNIFICFVFFCLMINSITKIQLQLEYRRKTTKQQNTKTVSICYYFNL